MEKKMADTTLSGSRLNAGRVIILHGPPGAGKSTTVDKVKKAASSGVYAYDAENGSTPEARKTNLEAWLNDHVDKKFHYIVIGAADQSGFLIDTLPLAKHIFISPGAEELEARHLSRSETNPAKLRQKSSEIYQAMLADPRFMSMEPVDDAVVWLTEYTSALPRDAGRAPISESEARDLLLSDEFVSGSKSSMGVGRPLTDDEIRAELLGSFDDTNL